MRHRLFQFAFLLATLLTIFLCILSVRSFWIADAWGWSSGKRAIQCGLAGGRFRLDTTLLAEDGGNWPHPSFAHGEYPASMDPPTQRLPTTVHNLGFSLAHIFQPHNFSSSLILIPLWLPLLLCLLIVEFLRRLTHRSLHRERRNRGLCPHCGYDMRATPSGCPECGR